MGRLLALLLIIFTVPVFAQDGADARGPRGYYRFPTIHDGTIVFTAEGDLWKVPAEGGTARRITTHQGPETHARFSPDGSLIAFVAEYEGPREVYTMPSTGGLPTRQTYEGEWVLVVGWTPDGKILYNTRKHSTLRRHQLATIDPEDGTIERVPLDQAADGDVGPGGALFFTRLSPNFSYTKRYRGGAAQNIWRYDEGAAEAVPLTADFPGMSSSPMVWNGRVYFVTDRDGTVNIWSMNSDGGDRRQHTFHDGWDVKGPSLGGGKIAYQLGADIRLYDIASGRDRDVPITLSSDFDQTREKWVKNPMDYLSEAHISPGGDRVVVTARGKVFTAPAEQGRFVEATRKHGVRYRAARFLPDEKNLVVLSDESGEVEWWKLPADGIGEPEQITDDGKVLRFRGTPSPDGKWLAYTDHNQQLWLLDLESGDQKLIAFSQHWGFSGPFWSPDSRWISFGMPANNTIWQVLVYDVEKGSTHPVTTDRYDSWDPQWSPDGKWLYFLSDRHFDSLARAPWGSHQPEPYFDKQAKLYHVALVPGERSPFQPDDELMPENDTEEEEDDDEDVTVTIDFDGIQERLQEVPLDPGNYNDLLVNEERLFYVSLSTSVERVRDLHTLDIGNDGDEPELLVEDIKGYELSANGENLLVYKGNNLYVLEASTDASPDLGEAKVDLSSFTFSLDPKEEWRQMFVDSWRLERDYFYDPNMHSVDWEAMLDKYLPLVDRVTTRGELADLQGQMAGELMALHTYVYGGDHRSGDDNVDPAGLGAVLKRDESAGGYRVEHIYLSDPDIPDQISPLVRQGVGVREGDVIQAINGTSVLSVRHPGALLRNQAGAQVRLTVGSGGETRDVIVEPIPPNRERDLRYDEWEYTRRLRVEELGDDRIGYVHLRAMGPEDIAQWFREFFPVFDRQGLIVDVRHNNGGSIDSWILGRLIRQAWMYWQPRVGATYWNMQYAFRGHMVCLVNEWTISDGEAFAEGFRRLGLGKIIGTRTWGGEIWLTSSNRLVDKGIVTAAEFGVYGPEGAWLIEGHGVEPDIVVDNLPHATFQGEDAQLDAAIRHLQELILEDPRDVPEPPAYPDMTGSGGEGDLGRTGPRE